jgi:predicted O-methyltransferase YrrM
MELSKDIEKYILNHIDEEDPVLAELYRETNLRAIHPRMVSGHIQGTFLSMLSKMIRPINILEIGTFTGYSAICLAKGLAPGGRIFTIEIDDEIREFASGYFQKSGYAEAIVQITGNALKIIPGLNEKFELVFIDGDKKDYPEYYRLVFDKVAAGGYIFADNTLWGDKVVNNPPATDAQTRGVLKFNQIVNDDNRVEKVILPFRDGMTIIRKKQPSPTEPVSD